MTEPTVEVGPRERRRRGSKTLAREQLLDAAEEIFGRKGFHDTTLREIADQAEFSVGSVYSFFESKEDVFRQIFLRRGTAFMQEFRTHLARDGDPIELLHAVVDFEVDWFRRHRHFGRVYLRHATSSLLALDDHVLAVIDENFQEAMTLQADLFRRGQRAGRFRPGDPNVLARFFSSMMVAYQGLDPAVVSDDRRAPERFALRELHDLIAATFTRNETHRG